MTTKGFDHSEQEISSDHQHFCCPACQRFFQTLRGRSVPPEVYAPEEPTEIRWVVTWNKDGVWNVAIALAAPDLHAAPFVMKELGEYLRRSEKKEVGFCRFFDCLAPICPERDRVRMHLA